MKLYQLMLAFILISAITYGQSLAVNTDGSTAHPNALLDIKGINKGLLIPRGDAATRTVLNGNTAKGLLMYDTVLNTVWMHNGNGLPTGWNSLATGTNYWQLNGTLGTEIKNTNAGGFWSANASAVLSDPGTIQPPVSGVGTRLMWIPQKSAFRVGTTTGNDWNADSIGVYSFASGIDVRAKGVGAIALGFESIANGSVSFAVGHLANASGAGSVAIGENSAASNISSLALGNLAKSTEINSVAIGNNASANGPWSHAIGNFARTYAFSSTAMGLSTLSNSYASMAIGQYNDTIAGANRISWVNTEPLFVVGNGTSLASKHNAMVVYKNGNLVLKNPTTVLSDPPGFTVPISGSGTRIMWLPEKSAFRAGTVTGNDWDADSIGLYSFAGGYNARAKGTASFAYGNSAIASGISSLALGTSATASGDGSISMGLFSTAVNNGSIALGQGAYAGGAYSIAVGNNVNALGLYSFGLGNTVNATGNNSIAMGANSDAAGSNAIAIGTGAVAGGTYSISMGDNTSAVGVNSTAFGQTTNAVSYLSTAIGRNNDTIAGSSRTAWVATDPLFYVGNGSTPLAPSNAMIIYKNGNTDISGYTQLGKTTEAAPAIKMKKLTTTSSSSQGGLVTVAHGLNRAKILGVQVLLTYAAGVADIPGPYLDVAGYEYNWQVTSTDINIYNKTGNSANILSKPIRILITYEE